jgi:outer membrane protein assembly factor BamB
MADKFDQRLEHDLDTWWDAAMAGLEPLANTAPLRADIDTARYVAARHKGLAPSPTFARVLKEDLMNRVALPNEVTELPTADSSGQGTASVSARVQQAFWPAQRGRLRGLIEIAAVAALVLLFVGAGFGDGPFAGLNNLLPNADEQSGNTGSVGMYRGNAARTGVSTDPGPKGPPALRWQSRVGQDWPIDWIMPVAVGASGRVYVTNGGLGEVSAIDAATGSLFWRATVGRMWNTAPTVGNELVYVATSGLKVSGSDAGFLIALDASTGRERWRYETGGSSNSSPALDGDTIYVTTEDLSLRAADALTGREKWRFDFAQSRPATPVVGEVSPGGGFLSVASPAVANGVVYVANNRQLIAVDARNGHEKWRFEADAGAISTPAVVDKTVYFTTTGGTDSAEFAYAIDASNGDVRWRVEVENLGGSAPAVADGMIFLRSHFYLDGGIPTDGGTFVALDTATGETVWTHETDGTNYDMFYASGVVYGTSEDGRIYALNPKTGEEIWRIDTGNGSIRAPTVFGDLVVVPAASGQVYAIGDVLPGATPVTENGNVVDVSGLPPCEPPRVVSTDKLSGTPVATLLPPEGRLGGGSPQILLDEIPNGEPPSGEAFAGILETLRGMAACSRPTDESSLQGFYTDDYFRRGWVKEYESLNPSSSGAWPIYGPGTIPATSLNDARLLPDGRVGVVIMYSDRGGTYAIFVEQDGYWLIDERYEIVDRLGAQG